MYEALVDLDNLVADASYAEHLDAANIEQLESLLKQAEGGNPGLRGLEAKWNLAQTRQAMRTEITALKVTGKLRLNIWKKCERANREHEYRLLYKLFCLDTHNNVAALLERHVTEEGENTMISFFGKPDLDAIAGRLSFGIQFAIQSAKLVHGGLRTGAPEPEALAAQYRHERALGSRLRTLGCSRRRSSAGTTADMTRCWAAIGRG